MNETSPSDLSSGEPYAVYLDRTAQQRSLSTEPDSLEVTRQAVLDYVNADPHQHYAALTAYLVASPGAAGVRSAERLVRHLVAHVSLDNQQRQNLARHFNASVQRYSLDRRPNEKRRISLIEPIAVLSLPVDGTTEVS